MAEPEQEIGTCRKQLIERLEKAERKLVLRIMDTQDLVTADAPWAAGPAVWQLPGPCPFAGPSLGWGA